MPADIIPSVKVAEYGDGSVTKPDVSMVKIIVSTQPHPQGWYKISIGQDETSIEASEEDGFYYAHNTYNQLPAQLPPVVIEDWPDIQYRGFMPRYSAFPGRNRAETNRHGHSSTQVNLHTVINDSPRNVNYSERQK